MLDFLKILQTRTRNGIEVRPDYSTTKKPKDLMIRGGAFYAIWDEDNEKWSTDPFRSNELIDNELRKYAEDLKRKTDEPIHVLYLDNASNGMIDKWHKYTNGQIGDSFVPLDEKLIFANQPHKKEDYSSKSLKYALEPCDTPSYNKLMSTLYSDKERHKIEWAIGSIVCGDSKENQKFLVLYGSGGTGKSTVLNIIEMLFKGYCCTFDAKALGDSSKSFSLEPFRDNPLVAIQHDGNLSKIEDNSQLNSLVSHEKMVANEKNKSTYEARYKCFLFMGTNRPVKITDGRSGLIRRLIDVQPTGNKLPFREYKAAMNGVKFELGGIASHCLDVYMSDPDYYDDYIPSTMMGATNDFYNFIEDNMFDFEKDDGTTLESAWQMYKAYCQDTNVPYPMKRMIFQEELKSYFKEYWDNYTDDNGNRYRKYYRGFLKNRIRGITNEIVEEVREPVKKEPPSWLIFKKQKSLLDIELADCPAQYANDNGTPLIKWDNAKQKLSQLDTSKLHYVKVPMWHIVIDFDICDEDGNKCFEKNLEAASKWPATYAELSKSGQGIHLHYIYTGDPSLLNRVYDDKIEIKTFSGNSSLRRMLTMCNDIPITTISSGLPLKGEANKVISFNNVKDEKHLRVMITKNLNKEIHDNTTESINFIFQLLEDAYNDDNFTYDVSDMHNTVVTFAAGSTHQAEQCLRLVNKMHFKSKEPADNVENEDADLVIFDLEVFKNYFAIGWKYYDQENSQVNIMRFPTAKEVADFISKFNLVGFNCRRYDNHILYGCMQGYSVEALYRLSQNIINGNNTAFFNEAYNISYTDIYDFCSKKQSLKKWEIKLGIHHQEWNHPWDEPVSEELWDKVDEYLKNDVLATEAVFAANQADFQARKILCDLAKIKVPKSCVNDTTNTLTQRIIFGNNRHPELNYAHLEETFPGYEFVFSEDDHKFHNMYRGVDLGFGGYVYSKPGMYTDVETEDVASMHPHSITAMNLFGEYTKNFEDLMNTRLYIKHKEYDKAGELFNGALKKYLTDDSSSAALSQALKIAINSVYGLTSAKFDNPFRDKRNTNNIVALRGALFMKTLQDEVESKGYEVIHIKTDSIKIANADDYILDFCMQFATRYGYEFENESSYSKMCLVNDAVYIARYKEAQHDKQGKEIWWTATGTQFQVPYVFKTLFSKEPITFDDMCEIKEVSKGVLYLDTNEELPDVRIYETELDKRRRGLKRLNKDLSDISDEELEEKIKEGHNYNFVGRIGQFTPVVEGAHGGVLYRKADGKYYAATGTKGYRWKESELIREFGGEEYIDKRYYNNLVNDAIKAIDEYGDFEWFASDDNIGTTMPGPKDLTDPEFRDYIQF